MITAMMTVGPAGRGYFALDSQPHTGYETRRIDWSQERFAYLLGQEVTTQELDVIAPQFVKETHGRYGKLVVVSVDDATYHNSPKIDKAFTFKASAYHGDIARGSSVQCFCGQCGSERTDVFSVDKSSDQTHGTLIVVNKPCASCGFTSNVNPVPEFSLQKALDKIYEK